MRPAGLVQGALNHSTPTPYAGGPMIAATSECPFAAAATAARPAAFLKGSAHAHRLILAPRPNGPRSFRVAEGRLECLLPASRTTLGPF